MAPNHAMGSVCVEENHTTKAFALENSIENNASFKQENAIIFFDWDDTLMASSSISKLGLCPKYAHEKPEIPDDVQLELQELEECVVQLLEKALTYGRVVIVTAAEAGWVELSASLFMPRLLRFFNTQIKVVSARSTYEYLYPDCPRRWKIEAFNNEVFPAWETYEDDAIPSSLPRHVISLGDGPTEREALINVKMQATNACHGKSMKFITYPKISELKMELELILENFEHLCTHEGDLDLQITWDMLNGGTENDHTDEE